MKVVYVLSKKGRTDIPPGDHFAVVESVEVKAGKAEVVVRVRVLQ